MPTPTALRALLDLPRRIGLGARIVLVAGLAGLAGTAGCIFMVVETIENNLERAAQNELEANLGLLRALARAEGSEFRRDGDRLLAVRPARDGRPAVETPLNGRLDVVDEVKRSLGGVATIFLGDTRIATNVTRPDGTRGVGTKLAPGAAFDAAITRGETYRGVNEILGRRHITIYEPIRDAQGRQIGLWFVGLPEAEFQARAWQVQRQLLMIAAIALVVAGILMILLVGWQLSPLKRIRAAIESTAKGEIAPLPASLSTRLDDVGGMARAVAVFQENATALRAAEGERAELTRRAEASRAEIEANLLSAVGRVVDAARMGDFSVRAERSAELGRLGALVDGLNAVSQACDGFLDEADRALAALAAGDLGARMAGDFEGRLASVADNFNVAAEALAATMSRVASAAGETRMACGDISKATRDLSARTEAQAAALEETSAAVEEISKTVAETAATVERAAKGAEENATRATSGAAVAVDAVAAIDRVETQAKKVVEIVGVMDGLAFQTNLLALNASVEAARAGDAGRGFAVVANEVRRLAQQSAEAARDVRAIIAETNSHVGDGVRLVKAAGDQLQAIATTAKSVATTFGEIRVAAKEQATGVAEIAKALQQMDEMTQANAAAAERTASAASAVVERADAMSDATSRFAVEAAPASHAPKRRAA